MKVRKDESVTRISKEVELDSNSWVSGRLDLWEGARQFVSASYPASEGRSALID